jgi:thioredoxin 1
MHRLLTVSGILVIVAVMMVGCEREDLETGNGAGDETSPAADVITLDAGNFDTEIESGVVLVDFWAEWCPPCRIQGPIVEEVARAVQGKASVAKLDIDEAREIAQRFKIESIPHLIVFKDGKPVEQFVGVTNADKLVSAINSALDNDS